MKKSVIIIVALLLAAALVAVAVFVIVPKQKYQKAAELLESGDYDAASSAFAELGGYSDSALMVQEAKYRKGAACLEKGDFDMAVELFTSLGGYSDSVVMVQEAKYRKGAACLEKGDFDMAIELFTNLADYADSPELLKESIYNKALSLIKLAEYKNAYLLLTELGDYDKAPETRTELVRLWALCAVDYGNPAGFTMTIKQALEDYYKDYKNIHEGLAAELVDTVELSEENCAAIQAAVTEHFNSLGDVLYGYPDERLQAKTRIAHSLMKALPEDYGDSKTLAGFFEFVSDDRISRDFVLLYDYIMQNREALGRLLHYDFISQFLENGYEYMLVFLDGRWSSDNGQDFLIVEVDAPTDSERLDHNTYRFPHGYQFSASLQHVLPAGINHRVHIYAPELWCYEISSNTEEEYGVMNIVDYNTLEVLIYETNQTHTLVRVG